MPKETADSQRHSFGEFLCPKDGALEHTTHELQKRLERVQMLPATRLEEEQEKMRTPRRRMRKGGVGRGVGGNGG